MKKNQVLLLPEIYRISVKTIHSVLNPRTGLFLCLVFATLCAAVAQPINYSDSGNWMCHPVLKTTDVARQQDLSVTVWNPDNTIKTVINYNRDTLADIFYIYPTIDLHYNEFGNTPMDSIDRFLAQFVYRSQVGIYAQFGRVFVPYYRQAKLGVFTDASSSDSTQLAKAECMEIAYNDIDSAFSNYLKFYNNGRKIILMGHSQGAYLMRFLLRKRFDNDPSLLSQLVVAVSGGEPNYASVSGSRTGGSLQNIKTCPPPGSVQECGCVINWRTWNRDSIVHQLDKASFFYNQNFVNKGLIYQTYDTINQSHIESNYDFGYATHQIMARYISLDSSMSNYVGFDSLVRAEVTSTPSIPGSTYLLIDTIYTPNDQRKITVSPLISPLLQSTIPLPPQNNYHIWDMQFVQNDLLQLLPGLIAITHPDTSVPEDINLENSAPIYPNPTDGIVHVPDDHQKIKSIRLYNSQGVFVQEYFTKDFSVSNHAPGIYFILIQTNKSTYNHKLIKQ
jgi:hypothetical protein